MLVDLHMHSVNSLCAHRTSTIEAIVKAASAAKVDGIGITDHLHPETNISIFADNRNQLSALHEADVKVWVGVEVDVLTLSGEITGNPDILLTLDYVLAGVHHYHLPWVESPDYSKSTEEIVYFAHENILNTVRNRWVHAVAHPWVGLFKTYKLKYEDIKPEWIDELGQEARKHQTALEIPVWALFGKDGEVNEDYLQAVVRPLAETGCPLMTGTDSHHPDNIGSRIDKATEVLMQNGASRQQIWSPLHVLRNQ